MPSFDTVSEVDEHELSNAIDQASREISTRFDFKGSDAKVTREESNISIQAKSEFQTSENHGIMGVWNLFKQAKSEKACI